MNFEILISYSTNLLINGQGQVGLHEQTHKTHNGWYSGMVHGADLILYVTGSVKTLHV